MVCHIKASRAIYSATMESLLYEERHHDSQIPDHGYHTHQSDRDGVCAVAGASFTAQDSDAEDTPAIVIEGPVQTINVNIITIADINIELDSSDPLLTTLQPGDVVQVQGDVDDSADVLVVQANQVVVTGNNIVTPLIAITGPVQTINVNIVTVFNIQVQFNPNDQILTQLNVGDVISVGGNLVSSGSSILIIPVQVVIVGDVATPEPEATPEFHPRPRKHP